MDNSIKNGVLQTVKIYLSNDKYFKLYIIYIKYDKKKYMLDVQLEYKDQLVSKSYQQTRYLVETIGLFAHRYELDIDCDDFEVAQQKNENQKSKKTLFCKFLKTDQFDKDIYLNRGMCKTIHSIFNDSMQGYSKTFCLEQKLHNDVYPLIVCKKLKSDNINIVNSAYENLQTVINADMPDHIKDIIKKLIETYDINVDD